MHDWEMFLTYLYSFSTPQPSNLILVLHFVCSAFANGENSSSVKSIAPTDVTSTTVDLRSIYRRARDNYRKTRGDDKDKDDDGYHYGPGKPGSGDRQSKDMRGGDDGHKKPTGVIGYWNGQEPMSEEKNWFYKPDYNDDKEKDSQPMSSRVDHYENRPPRPLALGVSSSSQYDSRGGGSSQSSIYHTRGGPEDDPRDSRGQDDKPGYDSRRPPPGEDDDRGKGPGGHDDRPDDRGGPSGYDYKRPPPPLPPRQPAPYHPDDRDDQQNMINYPNRPPPYHRPQPSIDPPPPQGDRDDDRGPPPQRYGDRGPPPQQYGEEDDRGRGRPPSNYGPPVPSRDRPANQYIPPQGGASHEQHGSQESHGRPGGPGGYGPGSHDRPDGPGTKPPMSNDVGYRGNGYDNLDPHFEEYQKKFRERGE